ncbi:MULTISPECIES: hypothetical protein [Rhizobium]|uniref:hypothetical protein n=1 Tax=Rhizobium TaxID=379 RepID=UPI0007EA50DD|nr:MULTISPECIES: hypothetical protein [Rhizobium]ANK94947.1 hypothetical protein AMK01_PD00065 [Rhizobium sp. N6212]ANL00999.1 hypothetical protein AMK00_PD00065 [Rhizobium sp. N621]ANL07120.1 hypothetical protein AMJ99_PD00065 [Rhizobium esperanzae]ANL13290.1 hypothetical protein AMJ98_PE00065 [Rhizobium sp. N1341]ANL25271.1 hypothetical protein AMJ96_PD00065 [Rhizobium sp. N113]
MKSLSPIAGKTILIIGEAGFLSDDARKAFVALKAVLAGPVVISSAMECLSEGLVFDAVIIDVTISDEAMLWVNEWLETRRIPFIFAHDERSETPPGGFVVSGRPSDIDAMIAALFGGDPSYYH